MVVTWSSRSFAAPNSQPYLHSHSPRLRGSTGLELRSGDITAIPEGAPLYPDYCIDVGVCKDVLRGLQEGPAISVPQQDGRIQPLLCCHVEDIFGGKVHETFRCNVQKVEMRL